MATSKETPIVTSAAEGADGATSPPPSGPVTPTAALYQQLAAEFTSALDKIATIVPKLEPSRLSTANFVRTYQSVPQEFLGTVIAAVERDADLQGLQKFDVVSARDTLQFLDAFRPVMDRVNEFAKQLQFIMNSRKAVVASDALLVYRVAKGLGADPRNREMASLASNMKRDLGRGGKSRSAGFQKASATPGLGVPPPKHAAPSGDRSGS